MRVTFHQRRRMPASRILGRVDEQPNTEVPAGGVPVEDETSDDELSDDESSEDELPGEELDDSESSDEEEIDEEEESEEPEEESENDGAGIPSPDNTSPPSTPALPGATTSSIAGQSTAVPAPTEGTATASPTSIPSASSTPVSSQSIPAISTNTLPSPSSFVSSTIPLASTSAIPVLNPGDLTTPTTTALPQSTGNPLLGGATGVPQTDNAVNPPNEAGGSGSTTAQQAGQIAGGTVGSIAFVGLFLAAIWIWRRRRNQNNRLSQYLEDDSRYLAQQPREPEKTRSPSSIMNQLMTAAYAAEEGRDYRDNDQIYDNYANEKQGFTAHENESTERLTVPAAAQLRHQSIAARTETTQRTESTWKTWGVLAGSSQPPRTGNWFVDRYFRTS